MYRSTASSLSLSVRTSGKREYNKRALLRTRGAQAGTLSSEAASCWRKSLPSASLPAARTEVVVSSTSSSQRGERQGTHTWAERRRQLPTLRSLHLRRRGACTPRPLARRELRGEWRRSRLGRLHGRGESVLCRASSRRRERREPHRSGGARRQRERLGRESGCWRGALTRCHSAARVGSGPLCGRVPSKLVMSRRCRLGFVVPPPLPPRSPAPSTPRPASHVPRRHPLARRPRRPPHRPRARRARPGPVRPLAPRPAAHLRRVGPRPRDHQGPHRGRPQVVREGRRLQGASCRARARPWRICPGAPSPSLPAISSHLACGSTARCRGLTLSIPCAPSHTGRPDRVVHQRPRPRLARRRRGGHGHRGCARLSPSLSASYGPTRHSLCARPDPPAEEFAIEIPDEDADRITTVGEGASSPPTDSSSLRSSLAHSELTLAFSLSCAAIDYITKSPEAR